MTYFCFVCYKSFESRPEWKSHIETSHEMNQPCKKKDRECFYCSQTFVTLSEAVNHYEEKHIIKCRQCDGEVLGQLLMQSHLTDYCKPHKCYICNDKFKTTLDYLDHVKIKHGFNNKQLSSKFHVAYIDADSDVDSDEEYFEDDANICWNGDYQYQ